MCHSDIIEFTMGDINKMVEESLERLVAEKPFLPFAKNNMPTEAGMKKTEFSDKFSEASEELADDIISICIYPHSQSINYWKGCAIGLCKRFVDQNIDPKEYNTYDARKSALINGLQEKLNDDFSALYKRIVGVIDFHDHVIDFFDRKDDEDGLTPNMDAESAYLSYGPLIAKTLLLLVEEIAKENYEGVIDIMTNFNPNAYKDRDTL